MEDETLDHQEFVETGNSVKQLAEKVLLALRDPLSKLHALCGQVATGHQDEMLEQLTRAVEAT